MLVIRDYLAINLDNCTDFYVDQDKNKIIFCMNMLANQGSCIYLNELKYTDKNSMLGDFRLIVEAYNLGYRIVDL